MKKKEITFEERKKIQLEMLEEIDAFCRSHNIKYTLAYGTLIGAIRHKGFIPWDDDLDLMMPLPDLLRFKKEFRSEKIIYCDIDTHRGYYLPFPRLAYKTTYQKKGLVLKSYGVNIDLYYIIGIPDSDNEVNCFFRRANVLLRRRQKIHKIYTLATRLLPIKYIPFYNTIIKNYRNYFLNAFPYKDCNRFFAVAGLPIWKEVYDFDMFKSLIDVKFENKTLLATADYHRFLTQEYGDYMTPPPENERVPYHGGHYYWK